MTMPSKPQENQVRMKRVDKWCKKWYGRSLVGSTVYVQQFRGGVWVDVDFIVEDED